MRGRSFLAFAVLAIALWGPPDASGRAASTAFQADPAHSGFVSDPALAGNLSERWSRRLGDEVSYPLIVGDRVYASVVRTDLPTLLYALDRRTGETLWTRSVHGAPSYDAGKIFTVGLRPALYWTDDTPPVVLATDTATGAQRWRRELPFGQSQYNVPPLAGGGEVYVGGIGYGGTSYTLGAGDGALRWTGGPNGYAGAALSPSSLLVAEGGCAEAESFDRLTGVRRWHYYSGCSGGGGSTPVLHAGRLYVKEFDGGHVLSAATGAALRYYTAGPPPAFSATTGVFVQPDGSMEGRRLPELGRIWSFRPSQPLVSAPLIVDAVAYASSVDGQLYGVALGTGEQVAKRALGAQQIPDERLEPHLENGLAAGGGTLVVPAGGRLVAFAADRVPALRGVPSGWSRAASEAFEIYSSQPAECRVDIAGDRGTWEPCGGSLRVPQPREGDYRLFARAAPPGAEPGLAAVRHWTVDRTAPELRSPVVERSWTVDATPPSVTIGPGPDHGTLAFTTDDPAAKASCRLDHGSWTACASPVAIPAAGTLEVRAVDAAGNTGVPARRAWSVHGPSAAPPSAGAPPSEPAALRLRLRAIDHRLAPSCAAGSACGSPPHARARHDCRCRAGGVRSRGARPGCHPRSARCAFASAAPRSDSLPPAAARS